MKKVIKAIKDCVASKTCCEETGVDCNQGRNCPVREGTHKPAEAVHQIQEPTVNQQLTIELEAFEKWLGIKPCGAAHDFGWAAWKARAALSATPEAVKQSLTTDAALPEPDAAIKEVMELIDALQFENFGIVKAVTPYELNTAHRNAKKAMGAIESKLRALLATGGQAQAVEQEPFGYFKAEPFGWTDCGPDDEGAVALYERPQAQADARDAEQERWMGIGKAIERACVDLPAGAEINIHLEKDAGTVTLSDCDGDEQENFPTDEGFAGVVNAAIDAAIAAAKEQE